MITQFIYEDYADNVDLATQLTNQTCCIPEEYRQQYYDYKDRAEELESKISSISSSTITKNKALSSPDPDPTANNVTHLLELENKRDYYKGLYELSLITLRNRCRDCNMNDEQTNAICMFYSGRQEYDYETVAKVLHTDKARVAYMITGGRTSKSRTSYKMSAVYMDIEASFESEKREELQAHEPDVEYPYREIKCNGGNDNGNRQKC